MRWFFDIVTIPIVDVRHLAGELDMGPLADIHDLNIPDLVMDMAVWFPGDLYETNASKELWMEVGVSLDPVTQNSANPDLDHFYSTPGDPLPDLADLALGPDGSDRELHDLSVGINDDTMNMAFYAAIQGGLLNNLNLTTMFGEPAKTFVEIPDVIVSLNAPPVVDWSVQGSYVSEDGISCYAGRYIVRNLKIDINDLAVKNNSIRMSVDVNLAMRLGLSADGMSVKVSLDKVNSSDIDINYLYWNVLDLTLLGNLTEDIVLYVMDILVAGLFQFDIPALGHGNDLRPYIYKADVVDDNNLVLWLGVDVVEEPELEP